MKSRTVSELSQDMTSDAVPLPEPVVKRGKVVNKGKGSFPETDCRRIDQKKMRSCIQARGEDGVTDYEKLRAANIKRNAMMLSTLGIPEIGSTLKNKKTKVKEAEKGKELAGKGNKMTRLQIVKGHEPLLKEKTTDIIEEAIEEEEARSATKDLCWSCKMKVGSSSSFFCGHCGMRQGGSEVQMVPLRCSVRCKSENEVKPVDREEIEEAIGIPDTLLTYERVFHPRPGRLSKSRILWGKGFLKKFHQRQHEKLNLNHRDVRHWFSNLDNEFVRDFFEHPSIRHDPHMMKRLIEFVKAREPELVTLLFVEEGITLRWKVEDIVRYAIEIKHYRRKLESSSDVQDFQ